MKNIAIFASGTGSNAKKIIEYFESSRTARVRLVISNKPSAPVLDIADRHGVDQVVIDRTMFYGSEKVLDLLQDYEIDWIVLAGFLWLIPPYLVRAFGKRMVNIHPALLPAYGGKGMYGMKVHQTVRAAGDRETGITIHFVNEKYDQGDIIFQARCPVYPEDDPEMIAKRVQKLEHRYFPLVIDALLSGREMSQIPDKENGIEEP